MPANYTGNCDAQGFYHEDNEQSHWLKQWIDHIGGWLLCVVTPVSLWGLIGLVIWGWRHL